MPRLAALPASPSFVETASTTGFSLRRWLLTAMVTGVSVMPCASLASVLPVHGATTSTSNMAFGPMGSAAAMVSIGARPVSVARRSRQPAAVPKRVSSDPAFADRTGVTTQPSPVRDWMTGSTLEKVQNDPVRAKPMRSGLVTAHPPPAKLHTQYRGSRGRRTAARPVPAARAHAARGRRAAA